MTSIRALSGIRPTLGERVFVDASAVVIGRVWLGDDVSVWPGTVIRGDVAEIHVGAGSNVQDLSVLHVSTPTPDKPGGTPLIIGRDVTIGHRVLLHACTIGDRCLVGMGAIVMDDAVLEEEVLLGAGSVVTPRKTLRARSLYLGNPAKRVRDLTEDELVMLRNMAARYVRVKGQYLGTEAGGA